MPVSSRPIVMLLATLLTSAVSSAALAQSTLRIAHFAMPPMLGQPFASYAAQGSLPMAAFFDTVTYIDDKGQVAPGLALSWQNTAPTIWQFTLRPGVTFHNGRKFDADAMVEDVNGLLTDPILKAQENTRQLTTIVSARKLSDLAVEIQTSQPDPILPRRMAIFRVFDDQAWKTMGQEQFARTPIGTGPFKAIEWTSDHLTGEAFTDGWRKPHFARLSVVVVPETAARVAAIASGQVDIAWDVTPDDVAAIQASGAKAVVAQTSNALHWALNTVRGGPVADERVRQALNYGFDKQGFVESVLRGLTVASGQLATRNMNGFQPDIQPYPYDPAKAKALLAQAGYAKGLTLTLETVVGVGEYKDLAESLADDYQKIGVDLKIKVMTFPEAVAKINGKEKWESDGFIIAYQGYPSNDMSAILARHSCDYPFAWVCFPEIMPLIHEMNQEMDPARRAADQRQIAIFYHDHAASVPANERVQIDGVSGKLSGYHVVNQVVDFDQISRSE